MGYMDKLHAEWLASSDADEYFEQLAEERDGYGRQERHERRAAEATLQQVDRICCSYTLGTLTSEQALGQITEAIGRWTDPDGPAGRQLPAAGGERPIDVEYDPRQGPLPGGAEPVDGDDDLPF